MKVAHCVGRPSGLILILLLSLPRDKIQVSQETADLITAGGRERWLKARDKKIMAKGKPV